MGYENQPAPGLGSYAFYSYEVAGFPVLKRAADPHFEGAMTKIAYDYQGPVACSPPPPWAPWMVPDYYAPEVYAISAEKSGETYVPVSRFGFSCDGERSEMNGFGAWREFYFGLSAGTREPSLPAPPEFICRSYQLGKVTDFTNTYGATYVPAHRQNFSFSLSLPRHIWDGRNKMTEQDHMPGDDSGEPGTITYADNSTAIFDRVTSTGSDPLDETRMHNSYNHWLFVKKDQNDNYTTYRRDGRRRIKRIEYQGGAVEEYTYNGYNQVVTHTLPSGTVEHYDYDGFQRLWRVWNEVDSVDNATIYTYDSLDRIQTVSHPWSRAQGAAFSVALTYNGRHQVIREEYPATNGETTNPFKTYEYDQYGNCTAIVDELGHRSEYTYDNYRRCTSYTEPLNAPGWDMTGNVASRRWEWDYGRYIDRVVGNSIVNEGFPASSHTSSEWRLQIGPVFNPQGHRRVSVQKFDCNNRIVEAATGLIQTTNANGQTSIQTGDDTELHSFTYDENGQKKTFTDPRGRVTDYVYDDRNRLEYVIEPKRDNQPNRPTTRTQYDKVGNKTVVTFPDFRTQRWETYDAFGQAGRFVDERGKVVDLVYQWGPMRKLDNVRTYREKDNNQGTETQFTNFEYDGMGRPQWTIFPDGSSELTAYQYGQISAFKNRKNDTKRFHYDARGREDYHTWDADAAPPVHRIWDKANRLTTISNLFSVINYGYDDGSQVRWEQNNVTGANGAGQVNYYRYPSGEVAHLQYPNGTIVRREYTARGQLELVQDGSGQQPVHYHYFRDGKVDYQDHANGTRTVFGYDGRGLIGSVWHKKNAGGQNLSYRDYWRDDRDRITAWRKSADASVNPMENGRGDRYGYDEAGQLTLASYQTSNPNSNGNDAERVDVFSYDALGNRMQDNQLASRGWMNFTRDDNGLNQYTGWWPYCFIKYDDDIGGEWGAPHAANGVLMQDGWITAGFNALNQPKMISSHAYTGTGNWMWFGFDPLGRCVKRWVSSSGATNTPGATFLYYDGWNLLQEGGSGANAQRLYIQGARVDEVVKSFNYTTGQSAYHHYDARGHCTMLTDPSGNILEQYDYDAFGFPRFYDATGNSLTVHDGPSNSERGYSPYGNRFLFTGREWLTDLKLYDYRNRMYQPELGRFLQPDPKQFEAGDYNLYRYCQNDPVNKSDPTGLDIEWGMNTYSVYEHKLISVTDAAGGGMHYFEFWTKGSGVGSRGTWSDGMRAPPGYSPTFTYTTTPEQDLVVLNALREAQKSPQYYSIFGHRDCNHRPWQVVQRALGSRGPVFAFDPVDRRTGEIRDAQGNSVGWENPDTGNVYDKAWNWCGWNANWKQTFGK